MCVIVYKPEGVALPSEETLKRCWEANPDGAGFMYPAQGKVAIRKGFMDWEGFREAFSKEMQGFGVHAAPIALHFRIATHGAVKPGCCHPFAVCKDYGRMRERSLLAEVGFMHNGVLSGLDTSKAVSDSMAFARNVLAPLRQMCEDFMGDRGARRIIGSSAQGSRFLLMDGSGEVRTFGRWHERDGVLYSNDRFEAKAAPAFGCGFPEHEQGSLFDAFCAFGGAGGDLEQLGLFNACEECPMLLECAEYLPFCADGTQAAGFVEAYA